jgi:hypothetical protein
MENKYENSGNLFPSANSKVVRQGKLDVEGMNHELVIVQVTTKNNKTVYEVYEKVGALHPNETKTEQKDWDMSGEIVVLGEKLMMWCRKKFDKNNNAYTRASVAPAREMSDDKSTPPQEGQIKEQDSDLDDDIPF